MFDQDRGFRDIEELDDTLYEKAANLFVCIYKDNHRTRHIHEEIMKYRRSAVDINPMEPCGGCGCPLNHPREREVGSCIWCYGFVCPPDYLIAAAKELMNTCDLPNWRSTRKQRRLVYYSKPRGLINWALNFNELLVPQQWVMNDLLDAIEPSPRHRWHISL